MMKKSLLGVLISVCLGSAAMGGEVQPLKVSGAVKPMNKGFLNIESYSLVSSESAIETDASYDARDSSGLWTPVSDYSPLGVYNLLDDANGEKGVLVSDVNYKAISQLPHTSVGEGEAVLFELSNQCAVIIVAASAPASDRAKVYASNKDKYKVDLVNVAYKDGSRAQMLKVQLALFLFADAKQNTGDLVSCEYFVSEDDAAELSTEVLSVGYLEAKGYIPSDIISFSVDSRELMLLTSEGV